MMRCKRGRDDRRCLREVFFAVCRRLWVWDGGRKEEGRSRCSRHGEARRLHQLTT